MHAGDIVSDAVRAEIGNGPVPHAALLVVACIETDGSMALYTFADEDSPFYAKEGLARVLLRDVLAVPVAAEMEHAHQALHSDDEDD